MRSRAVGTPSASSGLEDKRLMGEVRSESMTIALGSWWLECPSRCCMCFRTASCPAGSPDAGAFCEFFRWRTGMRNESEGGLVVAADALPPPLELEESEGGVLVSPLVLPNLSFLF
eukprot:516696-Rhodomonas_salina.2